MNEIEYNQLIDLMGDSNEPAIVECLELIQKSKPEYVVTKAITATEVWDIYSKRQVWNESTSNPKHNQITGYEALMRRLPKASSQYVRIHSLTWWDVAMIIFTDEKIAVFFGSLRIPKN